MNMKKKLFFGIVILVFMTSCTDQVTDNYIGVWEITGLNPRSVPINRIQIEKIGSFYLSAIEYSRPIRGNKYFFYPCKADKGHLIIIPSQHPEESRFYDDIITRKSEMHYIEDINSVLFLNLILTPSSRKIFKIKENNIIMDSPKEE